MSKQFGLILKKPVQRPAIFDESDSDESVPTGLKKTLKKQDKITQSKAIEEDPTVYQYDEVYDEMDKKRKESKLSRKDLDKKPKYINKLLAAADRRKKENERRIERQVQKERETEGDEFKDKESFVTTSYKKKLEEMKEMEEQEKREAYLESIGDVTKQGNLDGFYRHLYDQKVNYDEKPQETIKIEPKSPHDKSDSENSSNQELKKTTLQRQYRTHKESDSEKSDNEEIKKEHIPSNLDADSDFSIDSSDSEDEKEKTQDNKPKETDKTTDVENPEKIEEKPTKDTTVDEPPPPKKPKINIWKKRTVGEVFHAALQRYFERKALREL